MSFQARWSVDIRLDESATGERGEALVLFNKVFLADPSGKSALEVLEFMNK